ncbi:hypothetical protein [Solibacillus sp.]|uniref:hypothetical protein n=1 Tax=Solibacillus sp. TaxID=1909654 RepID=UPI003314E2AF
MRVKSGVEHRAILVTVGLGFICSQTVVFIAHFVRDFLFSSTATVSGENEVQFKEMVLLLPTILMDVVKSNLELEITLLRYFNLIGVNKSSLICELLNDIPDNLMPSIYHTSSLRSA